MGAKRSKSEPAQNKEWLTPREAAEFLTISLATVYRLITEGKLPHIRVSGRITRIPASGLQGMVKFSTPPAPPKRRTKRGRDGGSGPVFY